MLRYESSRGVILAWRQSTQTPAAAGTAEPRKRFYVLARSRAFTFNLRPQGNGRTGTLSATLAAASVSATGVLSLNGTASITLAAATVSATGSTGYASQGEVTATLADATLAATGSLAISGSLSVTLADVTVSSETPEETRTGGGRRRRIVRDAYGEARLLGFAKAQLAVTLADATLEATGELGEEIAPTPAPVTIYAEAAVVLDAVSMSARGKRGVLRDGLWRTELADGALQKELSTLRRRVAALETARTVQ